MPAIAFGQKVEKSWTAKFVLFGPAHGALATSFVAGIENAPQNLLVLFLCSKCRIAFVEKQGGFIRIDFAHQRGWTGASRQPRACHNRLQYFE